MKGLLCGPLEDEGGFNTHGLKRKKINLVAKHEGKGFWSLGIDRENTGRHILDFFRLSQSRK
jgi:hypothetical protein